MILEIKGWLKDVVMMMMCCRDHCRCQPSRVREHGGLDWSWSWSGHVVGFAFLPFCAFHIPAASCAGCCSLRDFWAMTMVVVFWIIGIALSSDDDTYYFDRRLVQARTHTHLCVEGRNEGWW